MRCTLNCPKFMAQFCQTATIMIRPPAPSASGLICLPSPINPYLLQRNSRWTFCKLFGNGMCGKERAKLLPMPYMKTCLTPRFNGMAKRTYLANALLNEEREKPKRTQTSVAIPVNYEDKRIHSVPLPMDMNVPDGASAKATDTIAAIVTAVVGKQGPGGVAIIRLSGPLATKIALQIFRRARRRGVASNCVAETWQLESHRVEYGTVIDAKNNNAFIDEVLLLPMLAPRSYTAEDVVEIHSHGGEVCSGRVLQLCLEAGARLAKPGEFTLRAFLNGRLTLAQAESVGELISARTAGAADSALANMQGGLSALVKELRAECIDSLVEMEARLDFDEDLPPLECSELVKRIDSMYQKVEESLNTAQRGRLFNTGLKVAIVGRPNVGKSSLLNAWSHSERAIVTNVAGTTRDVVEADISVRGIPVRLLDTAGMRATTDLVESIGVKRSEAAARGADMVLLVISAPDGWTTEEDSIFGQIWPPTNEGLPTGTGMLTGPMSVALKGDLESQEIASREAPAAPAILVINKSDCASPAEVQLPPRAETVFRYRVSTSALSGKGLQELESLLLELVGVGHVTPEGQQWTANQRQAEQLMRASEALLRLKASIEQELPIDFWTIDLREVTLALGTITGEDVSEEVLTEIFSRFCIGK